MIRRARRLVTPGFQVGVWWGGFRDALENFRQVHGVVVEAGKIVGEIGIAVPAMFSAVTVFYFAGDGCA
jgi:hypothetical protein